MMIANIADLPSEITLRYVAVARRALPEQASDVDLINWIAAGDKRAMHALYSRHSVRVFRFVLRLLCSRAMAEDVVSDVFLDVWRKADQFEGRSQVSTWLLAIARNKTYELLGRRSTEQLDDDVAGAIEDPADDPEMAIGKSEASTILRECLTKLSPAHRQIINLVYYHEKTVTETARVLGIGQNTVKTRMFYARRQLSKLLARQGITTALA